MKHKLLIVLLGLGTIAGYGASCASLHGHHGQRHAHFEDRVADVCVAAANRVYDKRSPPSTVSTPAAVVIPWAYPAMPAPPALTPPVAPVAPAAAPITAPPP